MKLSGSSRSLLAVALAACTFACAERAAAQNPPRKVPGGPWVIPNAPLNAIEPGRDIQWTVTITNPSGSPGVFAYVDAPQGNWLPPNPGGQQECEVGGQGGAQELAASQGFLFFPDVDGDGQCESNAVVTDAAGLPLTVDVTCDAATQILQIRNINVPGSGTADVNFITTVADRATPAAQVCNWGHLYAPDIGPSPPNQRTDTYPYTGGFTAGCSCLNVSAPSGFDILATKTATITAPGGRLIPGQRDATVQYTITLTNNGDSDITDGNLLDTVGGPTLPEGLGLEWVSADTCPAPLTCTINPAGTRLQVTGISLAAADPDESVTIQATARVTCAAATDIDDGRVCNQAVLTVTGQPGSFPTDDPDTPLLGDATCVNVVWSNLTTSQKFVDGFVDANGNSQLDAGERVNFRIRARNVGTLQATNVTVTDDVAARGCLDPATIVALDGGVVAGSTITWNVGDLAPLGGSRDVAFSAVLTQNALCCNQAEVQSDERAGCLQTAILTDDDSTSEDPRISPPDPTCASPGPQPDLVIEKSVALINDLDGDGEYDNGDRVRWTVTIENQGVGAATSVQFLDALPICMRSFPGAGGVTITTTDGADAGDATCSQAAAPPANPGRACVDAVGGANGILPGETVTITFEANVGGTIRCCNQGSVTYAESSQEHLTDDPLTPGLVDDETCLATPPCVATGRLEKRADLILDGDLDGRAEVGESVAYVMTFTNVGCGDLTNVRITDPSQACLSIETAAIDIQPPGSATDNSAGGTLDVTIPGPLAPSESVTIRFSGRSLVEGTGCCNQATWTATEIPAGGLSDYDVTDLTPERPTCNDWVAQDGGGTGDPDVDVTKTIAETGCQDPGGLVNYQITVTNIGTGNLAGFDVTDVLPAGFTNVVPTAPLTYDAGTGTVSGTGGPLAPRESVILKFAANLPCTPRSGTVSNTARVTYTDSTGSVERTGSVDVTYGLPVLTTSTKTATPNPGADGVLGPGDTVDYTIRVTNTGACDAKGVVVTDVFEAFWDLGAATIGQSGVNSPADTIRWDDTTTAALALIPVGGSVDLTVTVPVTAGYTTETRDTNTANIVAAGHPPACGFASPAAAAVTGEVCLNCTVVAGRQDLLVEAPPGPLAAVIAADQLPNDVFENPTANASTCGRNSLNVAQDVLQSDVGSSLAAGITIPGAQASGVLVFIEVSERCALDDPPAPQPAPDPPIYVRKGAAGSLIVTTTP
jgi:uncharacterized repeat protein (TIGR01451 family)